MPEIPKVRSNSAKECIGGYLADLFGSLPLPELNRLYVAAHYLKVEGLRRAIAGFLGCVVYIDREKSDFCSMMRSNKIGVALTGQLTQQYKDSFPFLN